MCSSSAGKGHGLPQTSVAARDMNVGVTYPLLELPLAGADGCDSTVPPVGQRKRCECKTNAKKTGAGFGARSTTKSRTELPVMVRRHTGTGTGVRSSRAWAAGHCQPRRHKATQAATSWRAVWRNSEGAATPVADRRCKLDARTCQVW